MNCIDGHSQRVDRMDDISCDVVQDGGIELSDYASIATLDRHDGDNILRIFQWGEITFSIIGTLVGFYTDW